MMEAFFVSAVGLQAQKDQLDTIAENLSNTSTAAYKRRTVDFANLLDRTGSASATQAPGSATALGSTVRLDMAAGEIRSTGRALDIAVVGDGFLEVQLSDSRVGYSRGGSLQVDANGMLTVASGHILKNDIRVPTGATGVEVLADGTVRATLNGESTPTVLGQLELVNFSSSDVLAPLGGGLYEAKSALLGVSRAHPGEDWAAPLAPRSVEASNVRMVDEMVSLMLAQRVYELNAKVAQAADEMMGLTNSLRK
jgi:flagellar basal-body rod protein FlgG